MPEDISGPELERRVGQWLAGGGEEIKYLAVKGAGDLCGADFFVVRPFPAVVFVGIPPTGPRIKSYNEQFLASRVTISERLDPCVPVIFFVPSSAAAERIAYADRVISVDRLPPVNDVFSGDIALNEPVQRFLQEGDPGDVDFSTGERVRALWSRAVSLRDLLPPARRMPDDLLGGLLQRAFAGMVEKGERFDVNKPSRAAASLRAKVISDFIGQTFGPRLRLDKVTLPKPLMAPGNLSLEFWGGWGDRKIAVRCRLIRPHAATNRVREIMRKDLLYAWEIGSALGRQNLELIMLLGSADGEWPGVLEGSERPKSAVRHPRLWDIHQYETAGWRVFPWDFAERRPAFVRFMEGGSYEAP